jgi:hypothetical protein
LAWRLDHATPRSRKNGELLGPATIGAFTVILDLDAIVFFVAD